MNTILLPFNINFLEFYCLLVTYFTEIGKFKTIKK